MAVIELVSNPNLFSQELRRVREVEGNMWVTSPSLVVLLTAETTAVPSYFTPSSAIAMSAHEPCPSTFNQ